MLGGGGGGEFSILGGGEVGHFGGEDSPAPSLDETQLVPTQSIRKHKRLLRCCWDKGIIHSIGLVSNFIQ